MKRILHICWGLEPTNGAANIARLVMGEQQAAGCAAKIKSWLTVREIRSADEVWCHCGWYYGIWWTVIWAKIFRKRICWMPECCYDPVRLAYHGWKKRLVGPIERWALRQCDEMVATCPAEAEWIRDYITAGNFVTREDSSLSSEQKIVVSDIKRFFDLNKRGESIHCSPSPFTFTSSSLYVLYLGRPHPLKGTQYLEQAVAGMKGVELRMVSDHRGEELERDWAWADVLCLPTLSDNFGLVVAEALERGKSVITTDGAPAWDPEWRTDSDDPWRSRVTYLKSYRNGTPAERVRLLREALSHFA